MESRRRAPSSMGPSSMRAAIASAGGVARDEGYSITSLSEDTQRGTKLHEGYAGNIAYTKGAVTYKDVGGLDNVVTQLDLIINGAEKYPEIWKRLGRKRTRGILLSGPPGCGKTLIAQAVAGETGRKVCLIRGAEIKGWRQGATEGNLISVYESVSPDGILIIDEIDAFGGRRESMTNEVNTSIVGTLCSILDGVKGKNNVTVIATTNKPHMLDSALRRPGRFDVEIEILPPNVDGRAQIFAIHTTSMPLAPDVDLKVLAEQSYGFTGADIAGACANINQQLLESAVKDIRAGVPQGEVLKSLIIPQERFCEVIRNIIPSLLRENYTEISRLTWDDIGGLDDIKQELQEMVIWPLRYKKELQTLQWPQPKGMLLYGPPGCGKTLIARAMAGESEYNFIAVNGPALMSMWVGNTEGAIRDVFWKARMARPAIIFFDEVEAIAPVRGGVSASDVSERAVSQLLTEINGVRATEGIFTMAATNRPDLVDPALLRPGRLDLQKEVPLPDEAARRQIFEIHLRGVPLGDVNFDQLAELTTRFSGADIEWTSTTAKKRALKDFIGSTPDKRNQLIVTHDDLLSAVQEVSKRKH